LVLRIKELAEKREGGKERKREGVGVGFLHEWLRRL